MNDAADVSKLRRLFAEITLSESTSELGKSINQELRSLERELKELKQKVKSLQCLERCDTTWFDMPIVSSTRDGYKDAIRSIFDGMELQPWHRLEQSVEHVVRATCFQFKSEDKMLDNRCYTTKNIIGYLQTSSLSAHAKGVLLTKKEYGPMKSSFFWHGDCNGFVVDITRWYHDEQADLLRNIPDHQSSRLNFNVPSELLGKMQCIYEHAIALPNEDTALLINMIKSTFHVTIGRYLGRLFFLDNIACVRDYKKNRNHMLVLATSAALLALLLNCYRDKYLQQSQFSILQILGFDEAST